MKRIYTLSITLMMVFLMSASSLMGQRVVTFTVNSPEEIKGTYPISLASIGEKGDFEITADLEYGVYSDTLDGCSTLSNDLSGKVAAVDRGSCAFSIKAQNAKAAGASVVLVFNNEGTDPSNIGGDDVSGIYVYGSTLPAATKIKEAIAAGKTVNVTVSSIFECKDAEYSDLYFWGNKKGEGDFSNGLEGWTVKTNSAVEANGWTHTTDGTPLRLSNAYTITSPTACNGAAIFPMFKYLVEENPSLDPPYTQYESELISPIIDCSGKESIALVYNQTYRPFNADSQISFSIDGGDTWSDPENMSYNGGIDKRQVSKAVPMFANQKECRIKFTGAGSAYVLIIDDVALKADINSNLQINSNWVAGALNYGTPSDQLVSMPIVADIQNISGKQSEGSVLFCDVFDPEGNVIYTDSLVYGSIRPDSIAENQYFANQYDPSDKSGRYTVRYVIRDADDIDGSNDTVNVTYRVTEDEFIKVLSPESVGGFTGHLDTWQFILDQGNIHRYGTGFYIKKGEGKKLEEVTFGFLPDYDDEIFTTGLVTVDVYEVADNDGRSSVSPTERILVGSASMPVSSELAPSEALNTKVQPLFEDAPIVLKDETQYMVVLTFNPFDSEKAYAMYTGNKSVYRQFDENPSEFGYLDVNDFNLGSVATRSLGSIDNKDAATDTLYRFGETNYINVRIGNIDTDTEDFNESLGINAYPNPTSSGKLTLDIGLEDVSRKVKVDFMDAAGKLIMSKSYANIQNDQLTFDVSAFANGIYMINVITDEGVKSQKVTIFNAK